MLLNNRLFEKHLKLNIPICNAVDWKKLFETETSHNCVDILIGKARKIYNDWKKTEFDRYSENYTLQIKSCTTAKYTQNTVSLRIIF